jgi:beta-glucosidase-like glycosyl hydrolase
MLNGAYAVEDVKGMQVSGDDKWPLKIHATLKHYTAVGAATQAPPFFFGYAQSFAFTL